MGVLWAVISQVAGREASREWAEDPRADQEALQRMAQRDADALADLYDRHSRAIFSFALHIVGEQADAEDVVQEVFSQAWAQAPRYQASRGSVAAWLFTITRSRAIDRLRARRARPDSEAAARSQLDDLVDPAAPADLSLVTGEQVNRLRNAIADLPVSQRAVVELAYFEGLTQTEMAARPFDPLHIIPLPASDGVDGVGGFNTHSIVMQVPTAQLVAAGPTIGIYASASRPKVTILENHGTRKAEGPWIRVSRLANPLINEVVIPLAKKDIWNLSEPEDDAQFERFFTDPEVTRLENALYPVLDDAPETARGDLVAILLTGVPTLNFTGDRKSDLIRLNTAIPPSGAVGAGNRLGLLAGDFAGFPNGRRLEDDVTDIELRAFACGYGPIVGPIIQGFGFCAGNANRTPNNLLGDGVDENDKAFMTRFPYVASPHQGHEHGHHGTP